MAPVLSVTRDITGAVVIVCVFDGPERPAALKANILQS